MIKEIYEKKHLFSAVFHATFYLFVLGCTLLTMILIPAAKNNAFESEWAYIATIVGFELLGVIILILWPVQIWERYNRYIDLCIGRQPAVIIGDDELQFYSPKGEYKCYRWDEIESFKLTHSKLYNSIQPMLKESWRNPKWYAMFFAVYTHTICTNHLDMPENELLAELNAHLR